MEPGNQNAEQMAVRHADASGGYTIEKHHEEKRKRDIHVGKRGSEAGEEQPDKLRKTVRFEQEARKTSISSDPYFALEHHVRDETSSRLGCRSYVMWKMTNTFLRWLYSTRRMDARIVASEKCWSGIEEKMPEIS